MRVGERVEYARTGSVEADEAFWEYERGVMDQQMAFAAWLEHLRIRYVDGSEVREEMTQAVTAGLITRAEAKKLGVRWRPDMIRVTRAYDVLPGPRGDCPIQVGVPAPSFGAEDRRR